MPLFTEINKIVTAVPLATTWIQQTQEERETEAVNIGKYGHLAWIINLGALTGGSGTVLTMYEAATATAGATTPIGTARPGFNYRKMAAPFSVTSTTAMDTLGALTNTTSTLTIGSTWDNLVVVVEVDNKELTDGYPFVSLGFACTTGITVWGMNVLAILSEPRYGGDVPLTAIS